jgi:chlorobactene glucosyltransferase
VDAALRTLARAALAAWAGALALARHERRVVVRAREEPPLREGPPVSVIVPARDEARGIGASVSSLRAQRYRALEVIVVDDCSRDATAAAAREAAGSDPRVSVVDGEPLPPGWVGKPWACWQGYAQARGEWLLFTDADVEHDPDAVGRTLALALRTGRGGVTLFPAIACLTPAERIVTPSAVVAIGTFVAPGPLARTAASRVAIAAGGFILVERGLYARVGGHRAIRGVMVDDVALAGAVKRAGGLLVPASGEGLMRLRMYHGLRETWRGWSKNASFGAAPSPLASLAGAAVLAALALAPVLAAARGLQRRDAALAAPGAAAWGCMAALQRLAGASAPTPARYGPTLPAGLLLLAAATARGAVDRLRGIGPDWRGRRYPLAR